MRTSASPMELGVLIRNPRSHPAIKPQWRAPVLFRGPLIDALRPLSYYFFISHLARRSKRERYVRGPISGRSPISCRPPLTAVGFAPINGDRHSVSQFKFPTRIRDRRPVHFAPAPNGGSSQVYGVDESEGWEN